MKRLAIWKNIFKEIAKCWLAKKRRTTRKKEQRAAIWNWLEQRAASEGRAGAKRALALWLWLEISAAIASQPIRATYFSCSSFWLHRSAPDLICCVLPARLATFQSERQHTHTQWDAATGCIAEISVELLPFSSGVCLAFGCFAHLQALQFELLPTAAVTRCLSVALEMQQQRQQRFLLSMLRMRCPCSWYQLSEGCFHIKIKYPMWRCSFRVYGIECKEHKNCSLSLKKFYTI